MNTADPKTADPGAAGSKPAGPRIDPRSNEDLERWARTLDATPEQLKDAIEAVGDSASDVEEHLKGSRATTNRDRVAKAGLRR